MKTTPVIDVSGITKACALFSNDKEIRICHANEAFYNMLGYNEQELELRSGNRLSTLLPVKDFIKIVEFLQADAKDLQLQFPMHTKRQDEVWVDAYIQKVLPGSLASFCIVFSDIQELKSSEYRLDNLYMIFQHLMDYGKLGLFVYSPQDCVIKYSYTNAFIISEYGLYKKFPNVFLESGKVHPEDMEGITKNAATIQESAQGEYVVGEFRILNASNEYIWIRMVLAKHLYQGTPAILCVLADIHNEKECSIQYVEQSMYYQAIINASEAYGHIDLSTDQCMKMCGLWNVYSELIDRKSYSDIFQSYIHKVIHLDDQAYYREVMDRGNLEKSFHNGITNLRCEFRRIVSLNKMAWMEISIHLFKNPRNQHLIALMCVNNIDAQKRKRSIAQEKMLDDITNLLNRKSASEYIQDYLHTLENDETCAFMLFDVHRMRKINETYGSQNEDCILKEFSNILTSVFRKKDILGRYERDRFIVLLKDVYGEKLEHRIEEVFGRVNAVQETSFRVSIGISFVKNGGTFQQSYQKAATALLSAHKGEENNYVIYNENDIPSGDVENVVDMEDDALISQKTELSTDFYGEFNDLVGENGDIAYLVNPKNYHLIVGNQAFYERLGLREEECRGKTCYELLHRRTTPCPYCVKSNWTNEKVHMYRNYNEILDQEFLIKNKLVTWRGNTELLAMAIDLSNNKMALDLLEEDISEEMHILSGIQNMQKHTKFKDVIHAALENIATFFRADVVRFWQYPRGEQKIGDYWNYYAKNAKRSQRILQGRDIEVLQQWLINHKWGECVSIETQELMMSYSYDMYEYMKRKNITNQYWIYLRDEHDHELGVFEIGNIHVRFQNHSYMQRFLSYIASEWKRCSMLDDILFSLRYDALTGLYNRNSYDEHIRLYQPDDIQSLATIVIDINGLNDINAMHGAKVGDQCLMNLAKTMETIFIGAKNYRLGGDEFQSVWANIDVTTLESKVESFRDKIESDKEFSVAVGYAWDDVEKDMKVLLDSSKQAMLVNKHNQKNDVKDIHKIARYRMQNDLISSIEKQEYTIFLQPKINARDGSVVGAEALIRYKDSIRGILPPAEYIPMLEKNGLIRYIDLFVFEEVCKLISNWRKQGKHCPIVSLNFSRLTMMEENLIEILIAIIKKYNVPKKYIEIEITETYGNIGKTLLYQSAKRIHEAGFSVSLDDFGTEFTNLSILSDIHVDVLKIDRSLIHSMTSQTKNLTILKHVIDMCHELNIDVIAEGVETIEQRNLLMDMGCTSMQGYVYSRPIDVENFEHAFLAKVK